MTALDLRPIPADGDAGEQPVVSDARSPLEHIKAVYRRAKGEPRLPLPVPGQKYLRIRFKPLREDYEPKQDTTAAEVGMDMLIACCDRFEVRTEDGRWVPLTDDGVPLTFSDPALSDALELGVAPPEQGGTARDVVLAVYSWAPKPKAAVMTHFQRLTEWMAGGRELDEERLLGES